MTAKNSNRVTIEISTETYDKLHSIKECLEEIFGVNVTFDAALKVVLSPKLVDYQEMTLKYTKEKPLSEIKTEEKTEE